MGKIIKLKVIDKTQVKKYEKSAKIVKFNSRKEIYKKILDRE